MNPVYKIQGKLSAFDQLLVARKLAPVTGNLNAWIPINVGGTIRNIPAW